MNNYQNIIKLEQAALTAQAEHRYDSAINLHGEAITHTAGLVQLNQPARSARQALASTLILARRVAPMVGGVGWSAGSPWGRTGFAPTTV